MKSNRNLLKRRLLFVLPFILFHFLFCRAEENTCLTSLNFTHLPKEVSFKLSSQGPKGCAVETIGIRVENGMVFEVQGCEKQEIHLLGKSGGQDFTILFSETILPKKGIVSKTIDSIPISIVQASVFDSEGRRVPSGVISLSNGSSYRHYDFSKTSNLTGTIQFVCSPGNYHIEYSDKKPIEGVFFKLDGQEIPNSSEIPLKEGKISITCYRPSEPMYSGIVTDTIGNGLEGIKIVLENREAGGAFEFKSGKGGIFRFPTYGISAFLYPEDPDNDFEFSPRFLKVDGSSQSEISFIRTTQKREVLEFRVVDEETGFPLEDFPFSVFSQMYMSGRKGKTDETGHGKATCFPGIEYRFQGGPGKKGQWFETDRIFVKECKSDLKFLAKSGYVFKGVVRNEAGSPVPGLGIHFSNEFGNGEANSSSDENGKFLVAFRHPGKYTMPSVKIGDISYVFSEKSPLCSGSSCYSQIIFDTDSGSRTRDVVLIPGGEVCFFVGKTEKAGKFQGGKVFDRENKIVLNQKRGIEPDPNGRFCFEGILGSVTIFLGSMPYHAWTWWPESISPNHAQEIEVRSKEKENLGNVKIFPGGKLVLRLPDGTIGSSIKKVTLVEEAGSGEIKEHPLHVSQIATGEDEVVWVLGVPFGRWKIFVENSEMGKSERFSSGKWVDFNESRLEIPMEKITE